LRPAYAAQDATRETSTFYVAAQTLVKAFFNQNKLFFEAKERSAKEPSPVARKVNFIG